MSGFVSQLYHYRYRTEDVDDGEKHHAYWEDFFDIKEGFHELRWLLFIKGIEYSVLSIASALINLVIKFNQCIRNTLYAVRNTQYNYFPLRILEWFLLYA